MRILVANDLYGPSSAAGVATAMARALIPHGHEVHFVATVQKPGDARSFVEDSGLRVHLLPTRPYPLRFRSWVSLWNRSALKPFQRVLDEVRPDVVHFHNLHIHFSYRALKLARARGVPVVLTVHDVMPFCFQKMFCFMSESLKPDDPPLSFKAPMPRCIPCARLRYNPLRNPFIRWHFKRYVSRLIAVSAEMERALRDNGIDNVETIANGIDPTTSRSKDGGAAFRAKHGLVGKKVVLYGGRLDHRKGAEHLLRAMARIRADVPNAALLVAGSGGDAYENRMIELAGELGIGDAIVTTGWLSQAEMDEAYAASDVICTPSLIFESFGLINAEGMLRGKPAVTSYFGGPKNVVEDGVSGIHVNPMQVDALVAALTPLLQDEALRARMGAAAHRRVTTEFALETQAARVLRLYERLVGGAS